MRAIFPLIAVAGIAVSAGCQWLDRFRTTSDGEQTQPPVETATAERLVGYLNQQAGYLTAIRYPDVYIDVYMGREHHSLPDSTLICAKPRSLSLIGGKRLVSNLVTLGSNEQEFWMLTRAPLDPTYLYCSHVDFPLAANKLPIPFDPDWALQALGMSHFDPAQPARVEMDQRAQEQTLILESQSATGEPVKKAIVFAARSMGGTNPQVRRHLVMDSNKRVVARADIKQVETVAAGIHPQTRETVYVQVPTQVSLEWPQQQFRMDLRLRNPKVNPQMTDADRNALFTRPRANGVQPINLAEDRFMPSTIRGGTPTNDRPRIFGGG